MSGEVSYKMSAVKDVSDIRKSLSVLITIMKCLGLYFDVVDMNAGSHKDAKVDSGTVAEKGVTTKLRVKYQHVSKRRCLFPMHVVYVIAVFLLLLANLVRLVYSIIQNQEFLALQFAFLVWYLHNVACITCLFYACGSKDHLRSAFAFLNFRKKKSLFLCNIKFTL